MKYNVKLEWTAKEAIEQYYEDYRYLRTGGTDLEQRTNYYRKIINTLRNVDMYLHKTRTSNGANYIEIDDIATVEYEIKDNVWEIVVRNIYFD
jgi:dynactin complex subunit